MKPFAALALALAYRSLAPQAPVVLPENTLDSLERQSAGLAWNLRAPIRNGVVRLIEADALHTASDYRRAADLVAPSGFPARFILRYEDARVWYELNLTAFAMGDPKSASTLLEAWDILTMSVGKGQRYGTRLTPGLSVPGSTTYPDFASKSTLAVVRNVAESRKRAAKGKDSAELQKLKDADQADRTRKGADVEERDRNDFERVKRVCQLADAGKIVTAKDFENAFLVLQHGSGNGFHVRAHEVAFCAALLVGNSDPNSKDLWKVLAYMALSYDRLLQSSGHLQRFGSQVQGKVDPQGICDAEREAMRVPPLKEQPPRG